MKIYTRTGDGGETGLYDSPRVSKSDPRIEALGAVDELNCWVGMIEVKGQNLKLIQQDLQVIGSAIATRGRNKRQGIWSKRLEDRVGALEGGIDRMQKELPELHEFILPRGPIHVARAVCRRAERALVRANAKCKMQNAKFLLRYLNRLSDYLFVLARVKNYRGYSGE